MSAGFYVSLVASIVAAVAETVAKVAGGGGVLSGSGDFAVAAKRDANRPWA